MLSGLGRTWITLVRILVPFSGDQVTNSEIGEDCGVGHYFRHDEEEGSKAYPNPDRKSFTHENMKIALDFAPSDETKHKAAEISQDFQKYDIQPVVDRLVDWISNHDGVI